MGKISASAQTTHAAMRASARDGEAIDDGIALRSGAASYTGEECRAAGQCNPVLLKAWSRGWHGRRMARPASSRAAVLNAASTCPARRWTDSVAAGDMTAERAAPPLARRRVLAPVDARPTPCSDRVRRGAIDFAIAARDLGGAELAARLIGLRPRALLAAADAATACATDAG